MKVVRLTSNCLQLTQLGLINAYLVREEDGFTLIDSCVGQAKPIAAAAQAEGAAIRRVILTHAHSDHVGSVDALAALLPDFEFMVGERESRLMAGDMSLDPGEPQSRVRGSYPKVKTKPKRLLQEGDRVGSLRVIAAPGHTPGQIAFLDDRDGTLFVGDAWSTAGGLAVAGTVRVMFPLPAMFTWNKQVALESGRSLHAAAPELLAVGHGDALSTPLAAMKRELESAQRRLS